jgi:hypothetical protein
VRILAIPFLVAGVALAAPPPPLTPLPRIAPEGSFAFEIKDAQTNERIPAKLTFLGVNGTQDPRFTKGDIGREEDGAISAYNRVYSATGIGAIRVPYGVYDVYVSRGPEWDRYVARNVRIDSKGAELRAPLRHVIETPGWMSADFHVHAARSSDSHVPMANRVFEFVADGVELIVSTDHNVVSDYAPFIAEIGVGRWLNSIIGDELTTNGWGHFGGFPLPHELARAGGGAVLVHGRGPKDFFGDVHGVGGIVDVHHPRLDHEIGYFFAGGFDARSDIATRAGFSYDFDAVEVLNGYQDPDRKSVDKVIDDWFALLDHGHLVTATGNSDSHHLTLNIGGYPRNYIGVLDDNPAQMTPERLVRAIKGHKAFFTTGPFIDLKVNKGGIGDLVNAPGGVATVEIGVRAAPWVSVSQVRLYAGGREEAHWPVAPSTDVKRFSKTIDVKLPHDGYIVVRVDGDKTMAPIVGDDKRFTVYPLALTNPVFVDVDGNGAYDPPVKHGRHHP